LRRVLVISASGHLAGGALSAANADPAPRYVRPAAPEYIAAAHDLVRNSLLQIERGMIHAVPRPTADGRLEVEVHGDGATTSRVADVVVNCTGSGGITTSSSAMLRGLAAGGALRVNRLNAGFEASGPAHEAAGAPGLFVIGPMLNEEPIENKL
jgi:uncharacterized NAD(P)/FAD-binding protein YdhS